jgi:hypothetical protein
LTTGRLPIELYHVNARQPSSTQRRHSPHRCHPLRRAPFPRDRRRCVSTVKTYPIQSRPPPSDIWPSSSSTRNVPHPINERRVSLVERPSAIHIRLRTISQVNDSHSSSAFPRCPPPGQSLLHTTRDSTSSCFPLPFHGLVVVFSNQAHRRTYHSPHICISLRRTPLPSPCIRVHLQRPVDIP